ncbi:MAG: isochorismatase family protein [Micromonosporaceae bacterium]
MDWNDFLTEQDREVFAGSGYGRRAGAGSRPVLLIVDVSYGFCGDRDVSATDSITRWHNACGPHSWDAVAHIQTLIAAARRKRLPIIYTTAPTPRGDGFDRGRWNDKNPRHTEDTAKANRIVAEIAPQPQDVVIEKSKPSAFFGTLLASYLADLQADSVIVCGTTTSGCVRATVVDAFSYNYKSTVVKQATFDRGEASYWINLFDMDMKYADVTDVDTVVDQMDALASGLFDSSRLPLPHPDEST